MRMLHLSAADVALLPLAIEARVQREMLYRVGNAFPEELVAGTARIDRLVAMRRNLRELLGDEPRRAVLAIGDGGGTGAVPGIVALQAALTDIFGDGAEPASITEAIDVLIAGLVIHAGGAAQVASAARDLLDAFGGDTPDYIRDEAAALEEALEDAR